MKKIIVFITVLCIIFTNMLGTVNAQTNSSKPPLSMQILGKKITTDAPIVKDDIIYLPFRAVSENLGYKVSWYSKLNRMDVVKSNSSVSVTVDSKTAIVNKKKVVLDYASIMNNGKLYVPYSFVESNFDYTITYDKSSNIIIISEKSSKSQVNDSILKPDRDTQLIFVNDKKIEGDHAPVIKTKKVFVPAKAVAEALGYTVKWNSTKNTMELVKTDTVISVTINSKTGYINNKVITLDEAPFLQADRVYVPIAFVQNALNCDATFDESKVIVKINVKKDIVIDKPKEEKLEVITNITDIVYDDSFGFPSIRIIADNLIEYTTFTLNNPERFVIDIQNAVVRTNFQSKDINKDGISKVRIAQNSIEPKKVARIVIDLSNPRTSKLVQSLDKKTLSVMYANIIKPVTVTKDGNKDVVVVNGSSSLNITDMRLSGPDRIVLDIKGAVHEGLDQTIEVGSPLLKSVRTGQFEQGTARIVLDLNANGFYSIKQEGNTAKIYLSDVSFDFFQYKKMYNTAYADLNFGLDSEYQINLDDKNKLLKLTIQKELAVEPNKYQLNDNIMEYAEVSKQKIQGKVQTIVTFKLKDLISYELLSPASSTLVRLKFKYNAQKFEHLTIVIDPGHGGRDPGAIGSDGTREKDLNMDVARRLNEKLKAIGFKTIMTRSDDTYVDLATRVDIANNSYADFFMSIHFNSFNSTTKGIETLYFPNTITEEYNINNKKIADIFHNEVVKSLNMPSRGITPRPNLYVLNKTKMPAILTELGFISNPDELARMKTEEYREMAAKALAVSIVKYFAEIQGLDFGFDIQSIYSDTITKL